jgi:hypothetical protein
MANPQPGGPETTLHMAPTLGPIWHGWPTRTYAPARIALQVTGAHKPPLNDKEREGRIYVTYEIIIGCDFLQ